jgi:2-amino-4-hydroxy-6-hydroxymethyldihydropteridine diphosphokinase
MPRVYLGVGSNVSPVENLRLGVRELQRQFGEIRVSPVYRSPPLGFEGDDFLNAVVELDTDLPPDDVLQVIERIHVRAGRQRDALKLVSRTLDIDLLLYDDLVLDRSGLKLPRSDVLRYSFVLRPLAELAPGVLHPVTGHSLVEHWRELQAGHGEEGTSEHPLEEVDVELLEQQ